jgi:predicted SprT family Zn-dependent metalloprotease
MEQNQKLQEVEHLALKLMDEFGLLKKRWRFQFNNRKKSLGCCSRLMFKGNSIQLSKPWMLKLPMEQVERVIRHEIAHALAPPYENHGKIWKEMCCVVGIPDETRCFTDDVISKEFHKETAKWKQECPTCGKTNYKHKRKYTPQSCGVCSGGSYNEQHKLVWSLNE